MDGVLVLFGWIILKLSNCYILHDSFRILLKAILPKIETDRMAADEFESIMYSCLPPIDATVSRKFFHLSLLYERHKKTNFESA